MFTHQVQDLMPLQARRLGYLPPLAEGTLALGSAWGTGSLASCLHATKCIFFFAIHTCVLQP